MIYELCSIPGVQVVTGERARVLIPDELRQRFKGVQWMNGEPAVTVLLPPFKRDGRHCVAVLRADDRGNQNWLIASARQLRTASKARALSLDWAAGVLDSGKGVTL